MQLAHSRYKSSNNHKFAVMDLAEELKQLKILHDKFIDYNWSQYRWLIIQYSNRFRQFFIAHY